MIKRTYWNMEELDENSWRVKVIGGWIVYSQITSNKGHVGLTSTFVQDRDHEWQVLPPKPADITPIHSTVPECLL